MPTFTVKYDPADGRKKGEEAQVSAESAADAILVYAAARERTPGEGAKDDSPERYFVAPIGTAAREQEYEVTADGSIAAVQQHDEEEARAAELPAEQAEEFEPADSEEERNRAAEARAADARDYDEPEPLAHPEVDEDPGVGSDQE